MQAIFSDLHRAARELAQAGTPVFPCLAGSKKPATKNGFHDATCDLGQIDAWWGENPEFNIAFSPHSVGLSVIDLDGPAAHAEWAELEIKHGFAPDTYAVETPRPGGLHLYFRGELPPTQHALAQHIDTRGRGSYALVPPSRIDARGEPDLSKHGLYVVVRGADPSSCAALPGWIVPHLLSLKRERAKSTGEDLDLPVNLDRARILLRQYVAQGHVAISGDGGNSRTFAVACEVQNLGVSSDTAFKLLSEIWNPACVPPWSDEELEVLVANAAAYAQNEAGAWAAGPSTDNFSALLGNLALEPPEEPRRPRFKPYTLAELAALPPPTWLIPDRWPADRLTMVYGQPGSFKSFVVLADALTLAKAGTPVLYAAGEGARELQLRAAAWGMLNECDVNELPIRVVGAMPWAADGSMLTEFLAEAKAVAPKVVILDTVARSMVGLNENDAKDMGTFVAFAETIQRALGAAVVAVHHSGKDDSRGARGSGSLIAAVDAAIEVKRNKEAGTAEVWVRRMKDAPERERPWTYRAQPLGQSMVLIETDAKEHQQLTHVEDSLSSTIVGAALVRLEARGHEHSVTTRVLAAELLPATDDQSPEAREQAISRMARALTARASKNLEAYALTEGRERVWFLPAS